MKSSKTKKRTSDAMAILKRRYLKGIPGRDAMLAQVRAEDAVGRKIYQLRKAAGLSQRDLAEIVGTTASVICRLEDADYAGHSLGMLHRIADALGAELEINFKAKKQVA
jgi:ribosome-binding protein aMBF1 (putative translation factor)